MDYKHLIDMLTDLSDESTDLNLTQKERFELTHAVVTIMHHIIVHYMGGFDNEQKSDC